MHIIRTLPSKAPARSALALALALLLGLSAFAPVAYADPSVEPPLNVRADAVSSSEIAVSWDAAAGADGYVLYRSTTENGPYEKVGSTSQTQFINAALYPGTTYYYRVASTSGGDVGNLGGPVSATTPNQMYQLIYDGNGADGGTVPDPHNYSAGDTVTVASDTPTRSGHQFRGWMRSGEPQPYLPGQTFDMPDHDVTLTAVWAELHTVTYDGNGNDGGTVPSSSEYSEADIVVVAPGEPTKADYAFRGWENSSDGAVYRASQTFTMPGGDVTLSAVWAPQADAHQNALAIDDDSVYEGDLVSFVATGHRQDEPGSVDGETRYIPVSWTVAPGTASGGFPAASPYRSSTVADSAGAYTLTATYAKESYDAASGRWTPTGDTEELSLPFTVKARAVDPVDPVEPDDPAGPVEPAPGQAAPHASAKDKALPQTGDPAPLAALAALGVLGASGAMLARRKGK